MNDKSKKTSASNDHSGTSKSTGSRKINWKKGLILGGVTVAVIALAALLLQPTVVDVETATAQRGPLSVTVEEQGQTRAKLRYTVAAPISGRLLRTHFIAGDRVERGEVLARIAPPPTDARSLATARAELAAAQARQRQASAARAEAASDYRIAKSEAARRTELSHKGFISAEALDIFLQAAQAAEARLGGAQAALAATAAEVESARSRLLGAGTGAGDAGAITIRAPVSGRVLKVIEESERVVEAGSPLFDLSEGEALELVVDVLTQDATQIQSGDSILITGWGGPTTLTGKVRYVEPNAFTKISALGVEEQRVNVIGDPTDPPPTLGAGYRIEAAIVTWTGMNVLQIPSSALVRRTAAWQAFVIEDGRARLRKLEIGHRNAEFAEVVSGIKPDERVIVFPSDLVVDGARVKTSLSKDR